MSTVDTKRLMQEAEGGSVEALFTLKRIADRTNDADLKDWVAEQAHSMLAKQWELAMRLTELVTGTQRYPVTVHEDPRLKSLGYPQAPLRGRWVESHELEQDTPLPFIDWTGGFAQMGQGGGTQVVPDSTAYPLTADSASIFDGSQK